MRISMGIVKNQHGVYHLRKKVPKRLEAAVALVTGVSSVFLSQATRGFSALRQLASKNFGPSRVGIEAK
jgi:hypothetical protein